MKGLPSPPIMVTRLKGGRMSQHEILQEKIQEARSRLSQAIVGQNQILDALMLALLARGHVLMIGAPGLAKTMIVQSLAQVVGGNFSRIQFTPDLMPSDITGVDLLQENRQSGEREFHFSKGPLFCNILLADEINRTPPKTQSALLQAMQEQCVSVGNRTWEIEKPFFVLATQNPIEQEGTYPLPEAQLDRFTFSLNLDYPDFEDEVKIATLENVLEKPLTPALSLAELTEAQNCAATVAIGEEVVRFAVRINAATRRSSPFATDLVKQYISWGCGPRASQFLVRAARARAFFEGRTAASAEDVAFVAPMVLGHRMVMNFQGQADGLSIQTIVEDIVRSVRKGA